MGACTWRESRNTRGSTASRLDRDRARRDTTMKRAILLAVLLQANLAGAVFKCVDTKGVTRIGETPPEECTSVVMYEVRPNGAVIRKIDPTPSPDQVKSRQ